MPGLWSFLHRFKTEWKLLGPLLLLNLLGMLYGWYYYTDLDGNVGQFDLDHLTCGAGATPYCQPWWTWPLVADSPNAVLLFFVAALAYKVKGWRNKWLDASAFILNVYVGCWTTFLFLSYPDRMGSFDFASVARGNPNPILFWAHMGMPLQALVLVQDMKSDAWRWPQSLLVEAGAALYIAVDYLGEPLRRMQHMHPAPFLHDPPTTDSWFHLKDAGLLDIGSPVLMVLAVVAWWFAKPIRRKVAREASLRPVSEGQ